MTFELRWTETAFKKLQKLDRVIQQRIIERLDGATADPFTTAKKLSGVNLYSIRIGDYRVIVSIERERMLILIVDLGHRSKIYKKL